tara:strand:+ start:1692 stop:2078 length:387 start_codon:yes stop_codon:yes gene_type:complete
MNLRNDIKHFLILSLLSFFILFSCSVNLFAEEINWIEVGKTSNQIQFIDVSSIKYNSKGFLSVLTKFSEVSPEDQKVITSNSYLMAVDCDNRLFSKLPVDGELKQVKKWEEPLNNKLIKNTILNSCAF